VGGLMVELMLILITAIVCGVLVVRFRSKKTSKDGAATKKSQPAVNFARLNAFMIGFGLYSLVLGLVISRNMRQWSDVLIVAIMFTSGVFYLGCLFVINKLKEYLRIIAIIYSALLSAITLPVVGFFICADLGIFRSPTFPGGMGMILTLFISPFLITPFYVIRFLTRPQVKRLFH
jgi:asparagine N-glycosylation enzyme membrane subunit Stt3